MPQRNKGFIQEGYEDYSSGRLRKGFVKEGYKSYLENFDSSSELLEETPQETEAAYSEDIQKEVTEQVKKLNQPTTTVEPIVGELPAILDSPASIIAPPSGQKESNEEIFKKTQNKHTSIVKDKLEEANIKPEDNVFLKLAKLQILAKEKGTENVDYKSFLTEEELSQLKAPNSINESVAEGAEMASPENVSNKRAEELFNSSELAQSLATTPFSDTRPKEYFNDDTEWENTGDLSEENYEALYAEGEKLINSDPRYDSLKDSQKAAVIEKFVDRVKSEKTNTTIKQDIKKELLLKGVNIEEVENSFKTKEKELIDYGGKLQEVDNIKVSALEKALTTSFHQRVDKGEIKTQEEADIEIEKINNLLNNYSKELTLNRRVDFAKKQAEVASTLDLSPERLKLYKETAEQVAKNYRTEQLEKNLEWAGNNKTALLTMNFMGTGLIQLAKSVGEVPNLFGADYSILDKEARILRSMADPDIERPDDWSFMYDPTYWATKGAQSLPLTLALMGTGYGIGAMAGVGASSIPMIANAARTTWGQFALANAFSRPLESFVEGAGVYHEAIAEGMSTADATKAAWGTVAMNMPLVALDAISLLPVFSRQAITLGEGIALGASKTLLETVGEGTEELLQGWMGEGSRKWVNGESYTFLDHIWDSTQNSMKQAAREEFGQGAAMGTLFSSVASVNDIVTDGQLVDYLMKESSSFNNLNKKLTDIVFSEGYSSSTNNVNKARQALDIWYKESEAYNNLSNIEKLQTEGKIKISAADYDRANAYLDYIEQLPLAIESISKMDASLAEFQDSKSPYTTPQVKENVESGNASINSINRSIGRMLQFMIPDIEDTSEDEDVSKTRNILRQLGLVDRKKYANILKQKALAEKRTDTSLLLQQASELEYLEKLGDITNNSNISTQNKMELASQAALVNTDVNVLLEQAKAKDALLNTDPSELPVSPNEDTANEIISYIEDLKSELNKIHENYRSNKALEQVALRTISSVKIAEKYIESNNKQLEENEKTLLKAEQDLDKFKIDTEEISKNRLNPEANKNTSRFMGNVNKNIQFLTDVINTLKQNIEKLNESLLENQKFLDKSLEQYNTLFENPLEDNKIKKRLKDNTTRAVEEVNKKQTIDDNEKPVVEEPVKTEVVTKTPVENLPITNLGEEVVSGVTGTAIEPTAEELAAAGIDIPEIPEVSETPEELPTLEEATKIAEETETKTETLDTTEVIEEVLTTTEEIVEIDNQVYGDQKATTTDILESLITEEEDVFEKKNTDPVKSIAYLNLEYTVDAEGKKTTVSNLANEKYLDILDESKLPVGTELEIRVLDESTFPSYNDANGTLITFADIIKQGELDGKAYEDIVPIGIYKGDKLIGFLHTPDWITASTVPVAKVNIAEAKEELSILRKNIVNNNKPVKTTIKSRSLGTLMFNIDKTDNKIDSRSVSEALPDDNIITLVATNSTRLSDGKTDNVNNNFVANNGGKIIKNRLLNSFIPGFKYVALPVGDRYFITPVYDYKIEEYSYTAEDGTLIVGETIIDSIYNALDYYYNDNNRLFAEEIKKTMGIDISTDKGIEEYVQTFINTKTLTNENPLLQKHTNGRYSLTGDANNRHFFGLLPFKDGKGQLIFIKDGNYRETINKNAFNGETRASKTNVKEAIRQMLVGIRLNSDLNKLNTNKPFKIAFYSNNILSTVTFKNYNAYFKTTAKTILASQEIGDNKYVYFAQPTVRIDLDTLASNEKVKEIEKIEEEKATILAKIKPNTGITITPEAIESLESTEESITEDDTTIDEIPDDFDNFYPELPTSLQEEQKQIQKQNNKDIVSTEEVLNRKKYCS